MLLKTNVRNNTLSLIDTTLAEIFDRTYFTKFPIDPMAELKRMKNCGYMTYSQLEQIAHCSHRDVIAACKSTSGCSTYDHIKKRYMVYINHSQRDSIPFQRIRWTQAHEMGHIICKHHIELINAGAPDVSPSDVKVFEDEADYFAACLLAPLPILDRFNVDNVKDIHLLFMLSQSASEYCLSDLKRYRAKETFYPPRAKAVLENIEPRLTTRIRPTSLHSLKKIDEILYGA